MEKKQRYSLAEVFICWNDDEPDVPPQRRLIALKPQEALEMDDNEIFYYCNGYEEFLNLIAYGYNTQDFRVIGVVRLIE